MFDKNRVRKRLEELRTEGRERFDSLASEGKERIEEFKVEGKDLLERVRAIIKEGNARKIIVKKGDRTLGEFPLAVGVGGAAAAVIIAPVLAAIGAIGALVSNVTVIIHKDPDDNPDDEVQTIVWNGE